MGHLLQHRPPCRLSSRSRLTEPFLYQTFSLFPTSCRIQGNECFSLFLFLTGSQGLTPQRWHKHWLRWKHFLVSWQSRGIALGPPPLKNPQYLTGASAKVKPGCLLWRHHRGLGGTQAETRTVHAPLHPMSAPWDRNASYMTLHASFLPPSTQGSPLMLQCSQIICLPVPHSECIQCFQLSELEERKKSKSVALSVSKRQLAPSRGFTTVSSVGLSVF